MIAVSHAPRRLGLALVALLLAAGLLPATAAPAAAEEELPVPYTFLTSAILAGTQLDASPPGANDWDCRPTRRNPRPVVLVHGLLGNRNTNWQTMSPLLKNNGYCVFALTYGVSPSQPVGLDQFGGLTRIQRSARELKRFVARVRSATGATEVDIVGHSEGTVVPNYYAKFLDGGQFIRRYVAIAPLWSGTNPAGLDTLSTTARAFGLGPVVDAVFAPFFASGPQLLAGSDFWRKLRRGGGPAVPGVDYTNIVTEYDQLVTPYTSGIEEGMRNHVLQDICPVDLSEHFQVVASPTTAQLMLNALAPRRARPVECRPVLPYVGTPG